MLKVVLMPGHGWLYYASQFTRASGRVVKALYDVIYLLYYSQYYLVVQP